MRDRQRASVARGRVPQREEAPGGANVRGIKGQQQEKKLDSADDAPAHQGPGTAGAGRFQGTDNRRHLRALRALLRGPVDRIVLDDVIGCTNAPYVIQELRERGLVLPCQRLTVRDRDGKVCRPGRYSLTTEDRARVLAWLAARSRLRRRQAAPAAQLLAGVARGTRNRQRPL